MIILARNEKDLQRIKESYDEEIQEKLFDCSCILGGAEEVFCRGDTIVFVDGNRFLEVRPDMLVVKKKIFAFTKTEFTLRYEDVVREYDKEVLHELLNYARWRAERHQRAARDVMRAP